MTSAEDESWIRVGSRENGRRGVANVKTTFFEEFFCKEEQRVGVVTESRSGVKKGVFIA